MTHIYAKDQGQRSLGSKVSMETDKRTEAIALPPVLMQSLKSHYHQRSNITVFYALLSNKISNAQITSQNKESQLN